MIKNSALFLIILLILSGCGTPLVHHQLKLKTDPLYPEWLTVNGVKADQTSGITFIKESPDGKKYFLLADDTGGILHLVISGDTVSEIKPIGFSRSFQAYIDTFPKADFEEIVYDKKNKEVFLSIEGNGPHPERYAGIYKLKFKNNDVLSDTIEDIKRLDFQPAELFRKYLADNIGYEGLAVDDDYFYLGLEGFTNGKMFADSSVLFIADRSSGRILKQVNTRPLGIHTICGLYSDKNYSLYGVDRNNKTFFHLIFDSGLNLKDTALIKIQTNIPSYNSFDYVASIESVTMDSGNDIYLVDDPWKTFFTPSNEILKQLDSLTVNHFRNFIPVIYKYSIYQ
jgi:hypothetical protein